MFYNIRPDLLDLFQNFIHPSFSTKTSRLRIKLRQGTAGTRGSPAGLIRLFKKRFVAAATFVAGAESVGSIMFL